MWTRRPQMNTRLLKLLLLNMQIWNSLSATIIVWTEVFTAAFFCRTWEDNVLAILCTKLTYKSNQMKLWNAEKHHQICGRRQPGTRLAQILRIREYNNCSSPNIMAFAAARMILKDKRRKPSREEYSSPRNRSKVYILHITQIQWWCTCNMWFHSLSSVYNTRIFVCERRRSCISEFFPPSNNQKWQLMG